MHTILGLPRTVFALAGIVVAIILVVVVGMIIIGSAAIRALMTPGVKVEGISLLALLVTIIVLLTAIFILLLVLFWCCCKKTRSDKDRQLPPDVVTALLPLLPLLPDIRNVMRDVAIALYASGKTLGWMHWKVIGAADFVNRVANDAANAATLKVDVLGLGDDQQINPLNVLVGNLRDAAKKLDPALDPNSPESSTHPLALDSDFKNMSEVATALESAGRVLGKMAKDLGATVPTELLPSP